jgi:hypothetical protein
MQRRGDHPSVSGLSGLVMVDVSRNDKKILSFINNKKGKGIGYARGRRITLNTPYLVLWLLENLMVYESLDKGIGYARGRRITLNAPYL